MEVDLEQLQCFRECPSKYRLKYITKATPTFIEAHEWTDAVLQTLFSRYIYKKLGGLHTQLQTMKQSFNVLWDSAPMPIGPSELVEEMKLIGLAGLFNFWQTFSAFFAPEEGQDPYILPRLPFNIGRVEWSTPKGHVIQGHIDAVYINILGPNVVKWIYYPPYLQETDINYELLLYAHAYKKKVGVLPNELILYYIYDGTSLNYKGSNTHNTLVYYDYLINALDLHQQRKTYYPRPGIHCRRCPFKTECMKQHGIDLDGGIKNGRRKRYPRLTGPAGRIRRYSPVHELRRTLDF